METDRVHLAYLKMAMSQNLQNNHTKDKFLRTAILDPVIEKVNILRVTQVIC